MDSRKIGVFVLVLAIFGAALLFSLGSPTSPEAKLVVYDSFAYYQQSVKVSGSTAQYELPSGIDRSSINLRIVNGYVISQYIKEANKTTESDLLKSYVGKEVSVFDDKGKEVKGTLLKYDDYGRAYVKAGADLFIITPSYYQLPGFNGEMKDENASVIFKISGDSEARLTYLLDSISWAPTYNLYLNGNGNQGSLSLYGQVQNSAKDYSNVSLSLFYGQVKRMSNYYYGGTNYYEMAYSSAKLASDAYSGSNAPSYTPTQASDYYKFDLGGIALPKGASSFNLFEKQVSKIRKTYEMQISGYNENQALAVMLAMNNTAGNGLGIGLPSGTIRVIDDNGFVGEASAKETPKGEDLEINTGNAFDIIGSSKLMNQTTNEHVDCTYRSLSASNTMLCGKDTGMYVATNAYSATVKNKRAEAADIVLTYSPYGDWVMENESMPSVKLSQNQVEWRFTIPANSEKALSFTIRSKTSSDVYPYYG